MSANVREAILKAADWIKEHPGEFNFRSKMPDGCGSPGCAIGWVGHFMGLPQTVYGFIDAATAIEGKSGFGGVFYSRMNELVGCNWSAQADVCAIGMRFYADKYFPAEPLKVLPSGSDICREIIRKPYKETADAA